MSTQGWCRVGDQPAPLQGDLCGIGGWGATTNVAAPGRRSGSPGSPGEAPQTRGQWHFHPHRMSLQSRHKYFQVRSFWCSLSKFNQ